MLLNVCWRRGAVCRIPQGRVDACAIPAGKWAHFEEECDLSLGIVTTRSDRKTIYERSPRLVEMRLARPVSGRQPLSFGVNVASSLTSRNRREVGAACCLLSVHKRYVDQGTVTAVSLLCFKSLLA